MTSLSKEAAIALAACLAALLIPVMVFMLVKFPLKLNPAERTLLSFTPAPVTLSARNWKEVSLACPVTAAATGTVTSAAAEAAAQKAASVIHEPDPLLTFILYGGSSRDVAILDGQLLHQGQQYKETRLVKIEQKRVLIENRKGKRWLTME
jgi:hypothetical protein